MVEVFGRCKLIDPSSTGHKNVPLSRHMLNIDDSAFGQAPIQRTITTYDVLANVRYPLLLLYLIGTAQNYVTLSSTMKLDMCSASFAP